MNEKPLVDKKYLLEKCHGKGAWTYEKNKKYQKVAFAVKKLYFCSKFCGEKYYVYTRKRKLDRLSLE